MNSLPQTVTRQRRGCDLDPGPSAPESSKLTSRLASNLLREVHVLSSLLCAGHGGRRRAFSRCCGKSTTRTSCSSARFVSVTFSSALANFCRSRSSSSELNNILGTGRTEKIVRVDDARVSKKSLNCSSERKCLRRPGTELTNCEYPL